MHICTLVAVVGKHKFFSSVCVYTGMRSLTLEWSLAMAHHAWLAQCVYMYGVRAIPIGPIPAGRIKPLGKLAIILSSKHKTLQQQLVDLY